jgi:hypothetical protein
LTSEDKNTEGLFSGPQHILWFLELLRYTYARRVPLARKIGLEETPHQGINLRPDGALVIVDWDSRSKIVINPETLSMQAYGPVLARWHACTDESGTTVTTAPRNLPLARVEAAAQWLARSDQLVQLGPMATLKEGLYAEAKLLMLALSALRAQAEAFAHSPAVDLFKGECRCEDDGLIRIRSTRGADVLLYEPGAGSWVSLAQLGSSRIELKDNGEHIELRVVGREQSTLTIRDLHNIIDAVLSVVVVPGPGQQPVMGYVKGLAEALYDRLKDKCAKGGVLQLAAPDPWPRLSIVRPSEGLLGVILNQGRRRSSRISFCNGDQALPGTDPNLASLRPMVAALHEALC